MIFTAIKNNDIEEVIKLAPILWNSRDSNMTPLGYACKMCRHTCIKILAPYGNINELDDNGHSPLSHVAWYNQEVEVELLLKYGADPNICSPLYFAVEHENITIVALLLKYGDNPNKKTIPRPLDIAIEKQNIEIVTLLLKHGADPPALDVAIEHQNPRLVELLLQYGAFLRKYSALNTLIDDNNINIIYLLLKYNYQFNYKILHYAIDESNELMTKLLLDNNVPSKDKKCNNALHRACKYNNLHMVRLILTYNFKVNEVNNKGRSPIFFVDDYEILQLLMSKGADINLKDHKGNTALHDAIKYKLFDLTALLLSLGADPLITNNKGWTATDSVDHWDPDWSDPEFSDDEAADANIKFKEMISSYEFCPIKDVGYD